MDPFLTTYRKDYTIKAIPKITRSVIEQEFKNPLSIGFQKYLVLRDKVLNLGTPEEYQDDYLEKFKVLYPKLGKKYFSSPINEPVINDAYAKDGQSIYQVDYCDMEKDRQYMKELKQKNVARILPDDWVLPSTSYLKSYRNPTLLNPKALEVVQKMAPRNNLVNQEKLHEIQKVVTGKSHYQEVIGELGETIIRDQMHGKMIHPKCSCLNHHPESK